MPAAYQDQNGKWWKECFSTKQLFGGVDTKEELGEWFHKGNKKDGFSSVCKEVVKERQKQYHQENSEKLKEQQKQFYQENSEKVKEKSKQYRQENLEKIKEQKKQFYQENLEKIKEQKKQYRQENLEKIKEQKKQFYQENSEKVKEKSKQYHKENSEKKHEQHKKYRKTPSGFLSHYKTSAKRRGINFTLTLEWFEEQMTKPEFNVCYYSGISFVDGINHPFSRSLDRISSTKGYSPDNVRWVCFKLNSWKSNLTLDEVAIMFKAMAEHHNVDPFEVLKKVA